MCKLEAGFRLSKKLFSSVKKCKLKRNLFLILRTLRIPYDTHFREVINHAKFDVFRPVISEELKRTYMCVDKTLVYAKNLSLKFSQTF